MILMRFKGINSCQLRWVRPPKKLKNLYHIGIYEKISASASPLLPRISNIIRAGD